jgi:hypothetical protein
MLGVQHEQQGLKSRGSKVLTEQEVSRSWARLFKGEKSSEAFAKAEALLDELRPESPLRHRLSCELEELRELAEQN